MSLQEFSSYVPDIRNSKNQLYGVEDLVFIAMVSVLCGAETWREIELFGISHEEYFKKRLPNLPGIPCQDTFSRFFSLLDIEWFEEAFRIWVSDICRQVPGVVAIDGKAVCRNPRSLGHSMKDHLYMVSAWAVRNGLCLGQQKVDNKSNEITAIPELIKALDLKQCIVTIDAAGCQKAIAETIINAEADYILCVKDNQKKLKHQILSLLSDEERIYMPYQQSYFQENHATEDKNIESVSVILHFVQSISIPSGKE